MGIALLLQTPETRLFIVPFVEFGLGGGAVGGGEELTSASLGSTGILGNQSQPASQPALLRDILDFEADCEFRGQSHVYFSWRHTKTAYVPRDSRHHAML